MPASIPLRSDFDAPRVRNLARRCCDANPTFEFASIPALPQDEAPAILGLDQRRALHDDDDPRSDANALVKVFDILVFQPDASR